MTFDASAWAKAIQPLKLRPKKASLVTHSDQSAQNINWKLFTQIRKSNDLLADFKVSRKRHYTRDLHTLFQKFQSKTKSKLFLFVFFKAVSLSSNWLKIWYVSISCKLFQIGQKTWNMRNFQSNPRKCWFLAANTPKGAPACIPYISKSKILKLVEKVSRHFY